jgi:hypothetical protein
VDAGRRHGASLGRQAEHGEAAATADRWRRFVRHSVSLARRGEERIDLKNVKMVGVYLQNDHDFWWSHSIHSQ